nr:MAG TPA: hypothetical protein [Crassvirales sp.]
MILLLVIYRIKPNNYLLIMYRHLLCLSLVPKSRLDIKRLYSLVR